MAVTADDVSGERLILGLGAGWHDEEYEAFGYPIDHRIDRYDEALQIIRPLLRGARVSFLGRYYEIRDAELAPKPGRQIPVLVAGDGPRMLRPRLGMHTHGTRPGSVRRMRNCTSVPRRSPPRSKPKAEILRPSRGPWG
jgi:hypothetical protein